jgi:hypothetical protein
MTVQSRSLAELVEEIESQADNGDEQLIATAMLVRELKKRIETGEAGIGVKWTEWANTNFGFTKTKLYELNTIAAAKDPKYALERYRRMNRERQKRSRSEADKATDPERNAVIKLIKTIHIDKVRKVNSLIAALEGH